MSIMYNKYKKGIMGTKLFHEDKNTHKLTQIKMPKKSKINLKVLDNYFMLFNEKEELAQDKFSEAYFDDSNPNIIIVRKNDRYYSKMMVDCATGNHTPLLKSIEQDYCVDHNDNILKISKKDCSTSNTGLTRVNYDVREDFMLCKNQNGKYVFLNRNDLEPFFYKEFDNQDVKCTLKIYNSNQLVLRVFTDKNQHYIVDNKQNILLKLNGDYVQEITTYNPNDSRQKIQYFKCYDKEKNKTTLVKYNKTTDDIIETKVVDNDVQSIIINNDKTYLATYDKNKKTGLVDENNKVIIPHKYDSLKIRMIRSKYYDDYHPIVESKLDNKVGVISLDGKTLLPCKYTEIDFSESRKYEDIFRFLAVDENKLYGVVNSNGQVEADFIYNHTHYTAPFYDKGQNPATYRHGLKLKNTQTGKEDFLTILEKDCVHKAADIIEYSYGSYDEPKKIKKTIEVPKYTEGEIIQQSIINGFIVNSPVGAILTAEIMKGKTVSKEIEVDQNSMDY